jgi:hypothetical protein
MTFKEDLNFGEKYQKELIKVLKPKNYEISKGLFKDYDIIINDTITIYYEVKADRIAYKTNNICIEYRCNNKNSGLSTTKADYYAYFIINPNEDYELYIIPVVDLVQMVKEKKYKKNMNGGDGKKSSFYIFSKELFKEYII